MDTGTIGSIVVAAGPLIAIALGAAIKWLKAEAVVIEQKAAASKIVAKLEQSNTQGDSLVSMGMKLGGAVIKEASAIPTLKPFVDSLSVIYQDAVAIWNDEGGSDAQMAGAVKAFNDVHDLIAKAVPSAAAKPA